jgi:hypothetical protein
MSELYRTPETDDTAETRPADADTGDGDLYPADDTSATADLANYEDTLAGDDYGNYEGTLATEEEGLPSRQEAWEQARGGNPESYDENELADVYDGDASALTAEEDGLPTRQEAREQAWGENPEYYDESDLAGVYDGNPSSLDAEEEGLPDRQEAWGQTWGDDAVGQALDAQVRSENSASREDGSNGSETSGNEEPGTTIETPDDVGAPQAVAADTQIDTQPAPVRGGLPLDPTHRRKAPRNPVTRTGHPSQRILQPISRRPRRRRSRITTPNMEITAHSTFTPTVNAGLPGMTACPAAKISSRTKARFANARQAESS